jgi:hypothetical protein
MTDKTCSERVADSLLSRATDIRLMLDPSEDDIEIADNGTLDTVASVGDFVETYNTDFVSTYRDNETGELDVDSFKSDILDHFRDSLYESFFNYGLSFDYVEPYTFGDQERGYFRYQISWGGPAEEFRFFVDVLPKSVGAWHRSERFPNPVWRLDKIEYWFLDWFDGAPITIHEHHEHYKTAKLLWDQFAQTGTIEHLLSEAAK